MEIATEAFILLRSINARLYGKYFAFFIYLSAVLLLDLLRFCVLTLHPNVYAPFYWYTEFLHAGIGYAVILEIFRQTLNNSPGVARIVRAFLWGVLAAVILKVSWNAVSGRVWSPGTMSAELERDLRTIQAILLAGIIALLAYYVVVASLLLISSALWARQIFLARKNKIELIEARKHSATDGSTASRGDLGERIFGLEDWDFVSGNESSEIQKMFLRERGILAIS